MSHSPQDWLEEAALRLEDARQLMDRGRNGRGISAAYYAVHAAGKGLLLTVEGIDELASHDALYKLLSQHFVRDGKLPDDTASRIQELLEERLAADYDLALHSVEEATALLDDAEALLEHIDALV